MDEFNPFLLAGAVFVAVAAAFALGVFAGVRIRREHEALDASALAERADTNGRALIEIARGLRGMHAGEWQKPQLERWACALESVAAAHLQCINAITLESLHAAGYASPWLGEFRPHGQVDAARAPRQERRRAAR